MKTERVNSLSVNLMKAYKALDGHNSTKGRAGSWRKGEWKTIPLLPVRVCANGFHCSKNILDTFRFVYGVNTLALVEVRGAHTPSHRERGGQKWAWESMRVLKFYKITSKDWNIVRDYVISLISPTWKPATLFVYRGGNKLRKRTVKDTSIGRLFKDLGENLEVTWRRNDLRINRMKIRKFVHAYFEAKLAK